jgi:hypothetical protein
MNKIIIALVTVTLVTSNAWAVMTDAEAKTQASNILSGMVSGHNLGFGKDNLYKESLDLSMWNSAMARMKTFVKAIMSDTKNFLGMQSSTLSGALDKISKAEMDLVNTIKTARGVLKSPNDLQKQVTILTKIQNDMKAVQKSLSASTTPAIKDEARKLLHSAAMFVEITATKAINDTKR